MEDCSVADFEDGETGQGVLWENEERQRQCNDVTLSSGSRALVSEDRRIIYLKHWAAVSSTMNRILPDWRGL